MLAVIVLAGAGKPQASVTGPKSENQLHRVGSAGREMGIG